MQARFIKSMNRGRRQRVVSELRPARHARAIEAHGRWCGWAWLVLACVAAVGCQGIQERAGTVVRPRALRDVPAERLAFRFEADVNPEGLPAAPGEDETPELLASIKTDFETRRQDDALLRTVTSPDGQRALALYATSETLENDFRMDLYSAEGAFIRNILPPDLSGTFPLTVAWSPDGQQITFIGIKNALPQPTPEDFTPSVSSGPVASGEGETTGEIPVPAATVAPIIEPVRVFNTEQIYIADRDGNQIRPLTTRDGLIYFEVAWSPDSHAVAALACKPEEWEARRKEDKAPAGRPRLIDLEGRERLLSDRLAEAAPVWSPDASKVATAFDTEVAIYDALGATPTGATLPLRELLLTASMQYDAQKLKPAGNATGETKNASITDHNPPPTPAAGDDIPLSFNPIIRLAWPQPETLVVGTAFQRLYKGGEFVRNYPRWHTLHLSPQAALLSQRQTRCDAVVSQCCNAQTIDLARQHHDSANHSLFIISSASKTLFV